MEDFLIVLGGYIFCFILGVGLVGFLQKGFFLAFFKVKASRGTKILIKVRDSLRDYYRAGEVKDELLSFKDLDKKEVKIKMYKSALYRTLNVNAVDYDSESGNLISRDYTILGGHDPKKFNNLLVRALTGPKTMNNEERIQLFILLGIGAICVFIAFMVFGMSSEVTECVARIPQIVGEI